MKNTSAISKNLLWVRGLLITYVCAFTLTAITAYLMVNEHLPLGSANIAIAVTQCISVFLGGLCSGSHKTNQHIMVSLIVMACYYFMLICGAVLIYGGQFGNVLSNIIGGVVGIGLIVILNLRASGRTSKHMLKSSNVKMNKFARKFSLTK